MEFKHISTAVEKHISEMQQENDFLFVVDISRDEIWDHYLNAFPAGTNEILTERREYDCTICRQFIKTMSNVVGFDQTTGELVSIWDTELPAPFDVVSQRLSEIVKSHKIVNIFLNAERKVGIPFNKNPQGVTFNHFFTDLDDKFVSGRIATELGDYRNRHHLSLRGLTEFSLSALEIVIELCDGGLYKGVEFVESVKAFARFKSKFDKLTEEDQSNWVWRKITESNLHLFTNSVIGTLVKDISQGDAIDDAVKKYESKTAPTNYKRTSSIVTKGMRDNAIKMIKEEGLQESLSRRYAVGTDIDINNFLFVDKQALNIEEDELNSLFDGSMKKNPKTFDKIEEIGIEDFINKVVPKISSMSVYLKSKHKSNLFSLVAAEHPSSPNLFSWDNSFSWSYNGEVTDAIKERVKKAGGGIEGELRFSLSWENDDDLDIHVVCPEGHIYYADKKGRLDVDANAGSIVPNPVENVIWKNTPPIGEYIISVKNYNQRMTKDYGFTLQTEFDNQITNYHHSKVLGNGRTLPAFTVGFDGSKYTVRNVHKTLTTDSTPTNLWGLDSEDFRKVDAMLLSPNHWGDQAVGNKHYFFVLDNCVNPEHTRGFYNEFLHSKFALLRKAFDVLGSNARCEPSQEQLSGVGFSSTIPNELIVKVEGNFNRTLKIKI